MNSGSGVQINKDIVEHATVEHVIGETGHCLFRKEALMRWKVSKLVGSTDAHYVWPVKLKEYTEDPLENN